MTLPIQRKPKHELSSPTPPGTPSMQLSPAIVLETEQHSTLPLSVETHSHSQFDSTAVKLGPNNGLLQIAQSRSLPVTPVSMSLSASFGLATSEEKMGDLTSRLESSEPSSPIPRLSFNHQGNSCRHQKYYGSIKKVSPSPLFETTKFEEQTFPECREYLYFINYWMRSPSILS